MHYFLFQFISVLKCGPSLLDVADIRVLTPNFRNPFLFTLIWGKKTSPSASSVSAANRLSEDVDIFRTTECFF